MTNISTGHWVTAWQDWQKLYFFIEFLFDMELITEQTYNNMSETLATFKGFAEDCENFNVLDNTQSADD